jgi:enoyl-CoA hydratase
MTFKYLHISKSDKIAEIEIDRPPVNALNTELIVELSELFSDLDSAPDVKVAILTGRGKSFVAGADISEMEGMQGDDAESFSARGQNVTNIIAHLSKPVIAAINGFALGGGCELALACDIRLAAPGAKLGQPEVKLGVIPGFGGTQRLPRLIGQGIAKELIFSGKMLSAEDAYKAGLVDRIVSPPDELLREARNLAEDICKNSLNAITTAKRLINDGLDVPLNAGLALERTGFSELFGTQDQKEGMKAFLAKREPKFKN